MFSATTVKEAINSKFKIWPADYMLLHDFFRLIVTLASVWSTGRTGFPNNLFGVCSVWKMLEYSENLFILDIQQSLRMLGSFHRCTESFGLEEAL